MRKILLAVITGAVAIAGAAGADAADADAADAAVQTTSVVPNRSQAAFPTIKPGSAWQDVRALQYLLLDQGAGRTDWATAYDGTTVQAVKRYQTAQHLPATGIANSRTLATLAVATSYGQNRYRGFLTRTALGGVNAL